MKLNLGCGKDIREGYTNLDKRDWGQDIVRDVLKGLPFDNNKFDEVLASHFLEHIRNGENLYFVFTEIWRVLKNDGLLIVRLPHSESPEAFYPDHLSYWNEKMLVAMVNDPYQSYGKYDFDVVEMKREGFEFQFILKAKK